MMPILGGISSLDYLKSLSPARSQDVVPPLVLEGQPQPPPMPPQASLLITSDGMDIFDSMESPKGLNASMHAPMYELIPSRDLQH